MFPKSILIFIDICDMYHTIHIKFLYYIIIDYEFLPGRMYIYRILLYPQFGAWQIKQKG